MEKTCTRIRKGHPPVVLGRAQTCGAKKFPPRACTYPVHRLTSSYKPSGEPERVADVRLRFGAFFAEI